MALGLAQQQGLVPGALRVGLAVGNELDASANFDALCFEDASGALLLRGHVTVRCRGRAAGERGAAGCQHACGQAGQAGPGQQAWLPLGRRHRPDGALTAPACARPPCSTLLGCLEDPAEELVLEYASSQA